MKRNGITLLVLVVTMIVMAILAGSIIITLVNSNLLDKSKKARFMSDFRSVQEAVSLYSASKYNNETGKFELPLKGQLTDAEKADIKEKNPTLNTKIEELSGPIETVDLAWINQDYINVSLSTEKRDKGYIIDVLTGQIYDYVGDYFEGQRWHTLDGGVASDGSTQNASTAINDELDNGWITLTLYYPAGSTEKKWRLGSETEVRADPMLMWQNYTGPITVPIDRVKDVWIKYKLNNEDFTIPPAGILLVDIVPDKTINLAKAGTGIESDALAAAVTQVNITINYDETATVKEYRVGNSGWITYTGPFTVTENCIVEARANKTEYVYNEAGTLLSSRDIHGRDMVYIGNIGIDETDLAAPTITRLAPQDSNEKARVQVTYPANADKKIYKLNYGIEQNYTTEISIANYGTNVLAYYYDATGKRSKASSIYINDTTSEPAKNPEPYNPNPPYVPGEPVPVTPPNDIPAPTIKVSPTSLTDSVQVSVAAPLNADKVYIKLGRYADYQEYTSAITVRQNMDVYAYYITNIGEKSNIASKAISNIKQTNKPYVYINANPYPWSYSYGESKVTITIQYSDANTIEYSEDGIIYKPYTTPFDVTENETIYARGTNSYGVTETSLNITNIGALNAPVQKKKLEIDIDVNPEPTLSSTRSAKASVTINYDARATEKYYTIGRYGTLNTYTGPFDVTSNCTIYAYAKATNAQGETYKTIDNVSSGIAEPIIISSPDNTKQASKVAIDITYDKYSTVKRYSIDGGTLKDYTGSFEVTKNGSVIYAYSQNELGQKSESTYTIQNIVPEPPMLLLDKGSYYLLKLNYPLTSRKREYKWKADGEWKDYKDAGILLIKAQYKDQLIQNGTLVKIEDENGNLVTFTGDYYFIDVPVRELSENIFMRWDRDPLPAPQILITPTDATKQVTATILYNSALVKKQYKIVAPDGTVGMWQDYNGAITIDRNNTVIIANGMDDTEVWTADSMQKITNIDENPPVIKLTADLIALQQKVSVKVDVTDDVAVGKIKWTAGVQGESYFANGGTEITNDSIVNITSNGYYTFYAEDKVGNKQVYTLNVTNVDLTPPAIDIAINPESTVGLSATATINYGDAVTKQYKIGTNNSVWSNYTAPVALSSYTILSNNWQNSDGSVTIYAKGKDSSGNEITVQKKVLSLDLDKPNSPIINSSSGYATLFEYGAKLDARTTITYDSRTDIDNYYSIDNGTTWLQYTGEFQLSTGTVIAKSVKKTTGLEVTVSQTIAMPADALKPASYDNNDTTGSTNGWIKIDSAMIGKKTRLKLYYCSIDLYAADKTTLIQNVKFATGGETSITIPQNCAWIKFSPSNTGGGTVYEIQPSNEPIIAATTQYITLNADEGKAIKEPYQMATITYFGTSVQTLYKIGSTGTWVNYVDQPVKLNLGETIYAKGIDQYGNETRIISSYTASTTDALTKEVLDGNDTTYSTNGWLQIDSSLMNVSITMKLYYCNIALYAADKTTLIQNITFATSGDKVITIPQDCAWMKISPSNTGGGRVYEIRYLNEPTFSATTGYMRISADPTKNVTSPYQMVTVNYFPTSVQKLYKIGSAGTWQNYTGQPVKVLHGDTIYAKGVDKYGNETRIISTYTSNAADAIKAEAFDGNDTTYTGPAANQYMEVDSSMQGKNIRLKFKNDCVNTSLTATVKIEFLDANKQQISTQTWGYGSFDVVVNVPVNTTWIRYTGTPYSAYNPFLYEIQASNEPTFAATNGYMLLTYNVANAIRSPYQMVSISYFPTSVQRLYKIGAAGTWLNYQDQPIKIDQGQTIYAKGIDQYGIETRIVSSYTADVTDALKTEAYDGNDTTYIGVASNKYMEVDSSMQGKNMRLKFKNDCVNTSMTAKVNITFLDVNKQQINTQTWGYGTFNLSVPVPANAKWIVYTGTAYSYYNPYLYEIQAIP